MIRIARCDACRSCSTLWTTVPIALAWLLCAACDEPLTAKNFNQPDIERVFSDARVIEQAIGSGFQQCHNSTISMLASGASGVQPQLLVLAFEDAVARGNNFAGAGTREAIPRPPILNLRTDPIASNNNFVDFSGLSRLSRVTSFALAGLDRLRRDGRSLGTPAQEARTHAFGLFVIGCALGNLALVYDSAAVVSPALPADSVPPLSSAIDVMKAALAMMDSAIAIANSSDADGLGGFPLPASWVGGTAMSRDDFVRFVRSWRARFRAGVCRTPTERAVADWTKIIADADAGISRDLTIRVGGTSGWEPGYGRTLNSSTPFNGNQMAPFYMGMADVSGAYDAWLATPLDERRPFLIVTPDRRFPQGLTRTEQQANSVVATNYQSLPLLFHRTDDGSGDPWSSFYSLTRYAYLAPSGGVGDFPIMVRAEMDLLMAEGYIRLNRFAEAAVRIDITRVGRGQLPPMSGAIKDLTDPVPGGANCVPRVPAPPDFSSTRCGNILEAMKWEKRLETAFIGYGAWFMDSRGWGDLIEGSPLEWPVPFQEMQARHKPFYSLGGGGPSSAARGTYGF